MGGDGKAFAADQSLLHASLDHTLKHLPKRIALTGAAVTVLREGRTVRYCGYCVLQAEPTEPAIGQIEMYLFAQSALGTNATGDLATGTLVASLAVAATRP